MKVSHTSVAMAVYGPVDWVIESTVSEPTGPVILEEAGDLLDADGPAAEVPCAEVVLGTVWAVSELEMLEEETALEAGRAGFEVDPPDDMEEFEWMGLV